MVVETGNMVVGRWLAALNTTVDGHMQVSLGGNIREKGKRMVFGKWEISMFGKVQRLGITRFERKQTCKWECCGITGL